MKLLNVIYIQKIQLQVCAQSKGFSIYFYTPGIKYFNFNYL